MTSDIQLQTEQNVLTVFLCRNNKKNALTSAMYGDMAEAIENATNDDNIHCIVITGKEDFSAGNDLADFLDNPPTDPAGPLQRFMRTLQNCPLPIIAAVDGVSIGIGTTLLLHCDLIYCTPRTRFALPFINLGVTPEFASSLLLPRLAGYCRTAELLMLGEPFDAAKALEIGLVNALIEPEKLQEHAQLIAQKIASKPKLAMFHTKTLLKSEGDSVAERMSTEMDIFEKLLTSPDAVDRLKRFFEKK